MLRGSAGTGKVGDVSVVATSFGGSSCVRTGHQRYWQMDRKQKPYQTCLTPRGSGEGMGTHLSDLFIGAGWVVVLGDQLGTAGVWTDKLCQKLTNEGLGEQRLLFLGCLVHLVTGGSFALCARNLAWVALHGALTKGRNQKLNVCPSMHKIRGKTSKFTT